MAGWIKNEFIGQFMTVSQQFDNSLELIQIPGIKQGKTQMEPFDGNFPFSHLGWSLDFEESEADQS